MHLCDAPTGRNRACRNRAGWGTDHPGEGRCRLHEGSEPITAGSSAPAHLRPATRAWFEGVTSEYVLEEHHRRLLTLAAEAWDRHEECREAIDKHGVLVEDRFGQLKANPACKEERSNRMEYARLLRELGLDVDDVEPPRPPALPDYR